MEPKQIDTVTLCDYIKKAKCFGLRRALAQNCETLCVLKSRYDQLKSLIGARKIYLFTRQAIKKASYLAQRHHPIGVIGL